MPGELPGELPENNDLEYDVELAIAEIEVCLRYLCDGRLSKSARSSAAIKVSALAQRLAQKALQQPLARG